MLITDWKTIGTAGDTIDGREITEQDLIDAAETYDKNEYTAVINSEHWLFYGNFGHVEKIRLSKDKKDRTILQAQLSPNARLIEKNKNGQGMFTSMELWPNFANSGKTYLSGLAVTDSPASLGTSMLKFSKQQPEGQTKPDRLYSNACDNPITLDQPDTSNETPNEEDMNDLFSRMKAFFKKTEEHTPPPETPSEDAMSKEALEKLEQQNDKLLTTFTELSENLKKHFSTEEAAPEGKKPEEKTPAVTSEQFSKLEDQNGKLLEAVKGMSDTFNKLLKEKPGTQPKANEGDADTIEFV